MDHLAEFTTNVWTAADLINRFGAIPLNRVLNNPPPGSATERDVVELDEHKDRLCELIDGTLVEKTVGAYESYLAVLIGEMLSSFARRHGLGIVLGEAGMMRLAPGLVRIPDVSFISWNRLPNRRVPREPIPDLVPDLAVEVISRFNTRQEMERKLDDYFTAGVRLVWYVYHEPRPQAYVYSNPTDYTLLEEGQYLDGGDVLPGFRLPLADLFAEPA